MSEASPGVSGPPYTLADAQALLPEARRRVVDAARLATELERRVAQLRDGTAGPGAGHEVEELRARLDAAVAWFEERRVQIKSLAPALLDFPARAIRDGEPLDVLLCWRDDEETIGYYHPPESGYRGREPVGMLDRV